MIITPMITCVVVTFNRCTLLERCLLAIGAQTHPPHRLVIVDNASTDGTRNWLAEWVPEHAVYAECVPLAENLGGAGGFAEGLRIAIERGADWVWMMDDDAEPHPEALAELLKIANDPANVYGSLATHGTNTSWSTDLIDPPQRNVNEVIAVPPSARVRSLPFLGFLIHRDLVERIGLPDAGFFIAADDVEYCIRASLTGAQIIIAGKSHIEHPMAKRSITRVFGTDVIYLRLPPWKRYYDTRNRLLIARKYYGIRLLTQTIPGSFVRLFTALMYEPRKLAQLWAFCTGMFDGLLGIKGRRHTKWGIRQ